MRITLTLAVGIVITVLLLVLVLHRTFVGWDSDPVEGRTGQRSMPETASTSVRDEPQPKAQRREALPTIEDLRARGFKIRAARIGRTSAEGDVEIVAPDGARYWGDDFRVSAEDGTFVLTGQVALQSARDKKDDYVMTAEEEDLFVRIYPNGDFYCSPGRWKIATQPNKSE